MNNVTGNIIMKAAFVEASKSNCKHASVGAVLVQNKKILVSAHNNIPSGINGCNGFGCMRELLKIDSGKNVEICNVVHAEQQLIINCALLGINPEHSDIFCTHSPCGVCSKILINSKIQSFFYSIERKSDQSFKDYFRDSGIVFGKI